MAEQKPQVFMDVSVGKVHVGRIIFELFPNIAPATVENFIALCTGERGVGKIMDKPLHYKGSFFYKIWDRFSFVKGGDLHSSCGTCGESIWGAEFPKEMPTLPLNEKGLLAMNICDRYCLGSHFIITVRPDHHLDRFHTVFGKIVNGLETLDKIAVAPWGVDVTVSDCGIYDPAETRAGKRKQEYLPEKEERREERKRRKKKEIRESRKKIYKD